MENEKLLIVNGKHYPMWSQFVERKAEWIGGILVDNGLIFADTMETKITDILLKPNGKDSAFFEIVGEDFSCGFDVSCGGITCNQFGEPWLTFAGYGGHVFRIKKRE